MEPASWKITSYRDSIPTFLFSCATAVRRLTFVVLPDNIFWKRCIQLSDSFVRMAFAAVFWDVTQRGALRDIPKDGCDADL